jgi:hypothetical protein
MGGHDAGSERKKGQEEAGEIAGCLVGWEGYSGEQ